MVAKNKIDSNDTGLRLAEEVSIGVLPVTPDWIPQEPNGYPDFGGETKTVARNTINDSRQQDKAVTVGEDASGSFSTDLTQKNIQDLMQGFVFADFRRKGEEIVTAVDIDAGNPDEYKVAETAGFFVNSIIQGQKFNTIANNAVNVVTAIVADTSVEVADGLLVDEVSPPSGAQIVVVGNQGISGDLDIDITGDFATITSSTLDFTTLGLIEGEPIFIGGDLSAERFATAANNGNKRIKSIAANALVIDKSLLPMVNETGTGLTIRLYFGRVLKNELSTLIKRRTYNMERKLGAPDTASTDEQAEYIEGAVPNQVDFNFTTEDKITVDLAYIGTKHTTVEAGNLKSGNRPAKEIADAYNSTSDVSGWKMSVIVPGNEAPSALFAFFTDFKLTINNGISIDKAIGCPTGFDASKDLFKVTATVEAYFADINSVAAVKNNSDVTLDYNLWKDNAGIAFDLPLLALGDGKNKVELGQSIKLPLSIQASRGAKIDANMDHTLMMVYFDYLPDLADIAFC